MAIIKVRRVDMLEYDEVSPVVHVVNSCGHCETITIQPGDDDIHAGDEVLAGCAYCDMETDSLCGLSDCKNYSEDDLYDDDDD